MKLHPLDPLRAPAVIVLAAFVCLAASLPATAQKTVSPLLDPPRGTPEAPEAAPESDHPRDSDGPLRTVIKTTMYIDVTDLQPILGMLDVQVRYQTDTNSVVLRARPDGDLDTALRLIEALDQPSPSIGVTVFILAGSREAGDGENVPEDLEAAVGQLKSVFGYQGFELLDSVFLRVLEGRPGRVEGGVRLGDSSDRRTGYSFSFEDVRIIPADDDKLRIRLDGLTFELNGAQDGVTQRAYLRTDVVIREGQKAVVGSSTPQGGDQTLILVVEAKVEPKVETGEES